MRLILLKIGTLAVTAPMACAQAFNLDVGPSAASLPDITYGAAAGQPGVWNRVDGTSRFYFDANGNSTAFHGGVGVGNGLASFNIPGISPGDEELMESYLRGDGNGLTQVSFAGLMPGKYTAYIYAWYIPSDFGKTSKINLVEYSTGTSQIVTTNFGLPWSGQVEGVTYAKVDFDVIAPDSLLEFRLMSLGNGEDAPTSVLNGIQIVPIPAPASGLMMVGLPVLAARVRR